MSRPTSDIIADLETALEWPMNANRVLRHDAADRLAELGGRASNADAMYRFVSLKLNTLDALRPPCPTCDGEGTRERLATPDEVDNGCELGIAYDPCPDCVDGKVSIERMARVFATVHDEDTLQSHSAISLLDELRAIR